MPSATLIGGLALPVNTAVDQCDKIDRGTEHVGAVAQLESRLRVDERGRNERRADGDAFVLHLRRQISEKIPAQADADSLLIEHGRYARRAEIGLLHTRYEAVGCHGADTIAAAKVPRGRIAERFVLRIEAFGRDIPIARIVKGCQVHQLEGLLRWIGTSCPVGVVHALVGCVDGKRTVVQRIRNRTDAGILIEDVVRCFFLPDRV